EHLRVFRFEEDAANAVRRVGLCLRARLEGLLEHGLQALRVRAHLEAKADGSIRRSEREAHVHRRLRWPHAAYEGRLAVGERPVVLLHSAGHRREHLNFVELRLGVPRMGRVAGPLAEGPARRSLDDGEMPAGSDPPPGLAETFTAPRAGSARP